MKHKPLTLLLICFFPLAAFAQKPTKQTAFQTVLEEVKVTASRTESRLSVLPLPTKIIEREEIRKTNAVRLNDLLNELSDVLSVPDFGGGEGVQMQGMDAQHILILVDGQPLIGRRAGTLDLNRIAVGNIKQIEIIKGASSSLYGSEALGGVINIVTAKVENRRALGLLYQGASFGRHLLNADFSAKFKKWETKFFIDRFENRGYDLSPGDGLPTVAPFLNYTLDNQWIYSFSEKGKVHLSLRYFYQEQNSPISENYSVDSRTHDRSARLRYEHKWTKKWKTEVDIYAAGYLAREETQEYLSGEIGRNRFDQKLLLPEMRVFFRPTNRHSLTAGFGSRNESLERNDFFGRPVFRSLYTYFQYDGKFGTKMNAIAGLRYDRHNVYGEQISPKLALNYQIWPKLSLNASVGVGFKAPDFRQLYFDFTNSAVGYTVLGYEAVASRLPEMQEKGIISQVLISPENYAGSLSPERSLSFNAGLRYFPKSDISLEINLFRNQIYDLIDTRAIARKTDGQNVFSYYNVRRVVTEGAEIRTEWSPGQKWKLAAGYRVLFAYEPSVRQAVNEGRVFARDPQTLQTFRLSAGDYFGLYNRSRHSANLKIFREFPALKADMNLRLTARSKFGLSDTNGNGLSDSYDDFTAGYLILDFALNKTIYKNLKISSGADNLLNFTEPSSLPNLPGRIFYVKLQFNLTSDEKNEN